MVIILTWPRSCLAFRMYEVSRPSRTTLIGELETIDKKIKATEKELKDLVIARGSTLMGLHGIGPCGAARLLADVGDVRGSPTGIGSRPGTAPHRWTPPPASRSGTGSPAPATDGSTERCTSWPSFSCATPPKAAPTSTATALVLSLSAGVAQADTQPANLGNVANATAARAQRVCTATLCCRPEVTRWPRWDRRSVLSPTHRSALGCSTTLHEVGCGRGSGARTGRRRVEARTDVTGRALHALRCHRPVRRGYGRSRVRLRRRLLVQAASPQQLPLGVPVGPPLPATILTEC